MQAKVSARPLPGLQTRPFPSKYGRTVVHTSRCTFRWDACLLALQGPRARHDRPAGTRSCRTMRLTHPGRLESSSGRCGSRPRTSQVGGVRAFHGDACTGGVRPKPPSKLLLRPARQEKLNTYPHSHNCAASRRAPIEEIGEPPMSRTAGAVVSEFFCVGSHPAQVRCLGFWG